VIKRIVLVRRLPELSHDEFVEHWRTQHARIAGRLPGLRRYVINVPLDGATSSGWDGVGELWFDDRGAMDAAFAELGPQLAVDLARFVADTEHVVVDEHDVQLA
jgi:uncharacterized protein (TIGR02118 family)